MKTTNKTDFKKWNELTEEEKQAKRDARKEQLNALESEMKKGIESILNSDNYKHYLSVMNSFHAYSINNTLLIYAQCQKLGFTPTYIKGFQSWKKLNRFVKKGAKAIKIYAPVHIHYVKEQDPNECALVPYGEIVEDKTIDFTVFKIENVFDINQTDGEDLPRLTRDLLNDVQDFDNIIKALIKTSPCKVLFRTKSEDEHLKNAYGYYHIKNNYIVIQQNIGKLHAVKTLCHEIAHACMHNRMVQGLENVSPFDREIQAESVAYILCDYLHLDTSEYSFNYIAREIDSNDKDAIKAFTRNLEIIKACACALIERLEKALEEDKTETKTIENTKEQASKKVDAKPKAKTRKKASINALEQLNLF